jgi:3-oxoadipate enol-lactonase
VRDAEAQTEAKNLWQGHGARCTLAAFRATIAAHSPPSVAKEFTMPSIRVRGLDMYYEIHGDGPPLLFISGTGGDLRQKPNISDSPLVKHFTVLSYDQRGLGQTSVPGAQPSMADYAADADALLDALGWPPCGVLGVSFGGMVAQEFALRYLQRLTRLVLACTSSGGAGGASYPIHDLSDLPAADRARRMVELSDTRRDATWQAAHGDEMNLFVQQTLAASAGPTRGSRMQMEARRHHDTYDRLGELRMPVYVCGGAYDGTAPQANVSALAERIPGATLEFFEGGHLFMLQDPRARPAMIAFLQE